jgi:hypothetical protein
MAASSESQTLVGGANRISERIGVLADSLFLAELRLRKMITFRRKYVISMIL